ncbi:MAG: hypothetical protein ACRDYW_05265 [Acidimicrobiales bacterium]
MRRVLLLAALLSLVGLTTAFATSLSVQTEDITSFTDEVDISVPPKPLPPIIYIGGSGGDAVGPLILVKPTNNSTTDKLIVLDAAAVQPQVDTTKYFTWQTGGAPAQGWLLTGTVTLYLSQDGPGSNRMTAGLFECDASAPPDSASTTACTLLAAKVADSVASGSSGFKDREVHFDPIAVPVVIDPGRQLRLKVVNQSPASAADWRLQWGYNPARPSALEITP